MCSVRTTAEDDADLRVGRDKINKCDSGDKNQKVTMSTNTELSADESQRLQHHLWSQFKVLEEASQQWKF